MATTVTLKPNAIDISGSTSGTTTLQASAVAGATTVTLPATTGTVITTGDTGTVTNTMLAGSITNAKLLNSSVTIGGTAIALGASSSTITNDLTISGLTVGKGGGSVSSNTAVGASALAVNTSGGTNAAFGSNVLAANTSGGSNTAMGYYTLASNTTGGYNVAIGGNSSNPALFSNTTGSYNTALGSAALQANTTASNNTAVGYQAGYTATVSSYNTFVGYKAGYTHNLGSAGNGLNLAVGQSAGYSLTTGASNTFVGGDGSGYFVTTGSKNSIIGNYNGNQGGLDIRTASNYIVLSDGDGNPRFVVESSGYGIMNQATVGYQTLNSLELGAPAGRILYSHISGTASGTLYCGFGYNGGPIGSITQNGTTAVAYNTSSDYRLKNTIAPMTGALAKVQALKPVTYKWNADDSDGEGFIAHELAEVCPHAVTGAKDAVDEEGKPVYQGIDTSFLVATLTAAIQELNAKFDAYVASHP